MEKKRYRSYVFTRNNYVDTAKEDTLECKYIVYGKEVGEQGTPHLQGFVYFFNALTVSAARKKLEGCHVEIADDVESAILYCKKGEQTKAEWKQHHEAGPNYGKNAQVTERGVKPVAQKTKGELGKEYWANVMKKIEEGKEDELDDRLRFMHAKTIDYVSAKISSKRKYEDTLEQHEWYWGETETGKSRKARTENPDAFIKPCNKWWDGYNNQEVVIIEDFDQKHDVLCHHLKIWGDRYPYPAEFKGGTRVMRPKKLIVTSNYHPKDIWTNSNDLNPILRRFKVTEFKKKRDGPLGRPPLATSNVVHNGTTNLRPLQPKTVLTGNTSIISWEEYEQIDLE